MHPHVPRPAFSLQAAAARFCEALALRSFSAVAQPVAGRRFEA